MSITTKYSSLLIALLLLAIPAMATGSEPDHFTGLLTNDNIISVLHPQPKHFQLDKQNQATGLTVTNLPFSQTNVEHLEIRLQRFEIEEAWWYVSDKGLIGYGQSLSDLQALSIYMTWL